MHSQHFVTKAVSALVVMLAAVSGRANQTADVFTSEPAAYSELVVRQPNDSATTLRRISVEERAGVARERDLVRVPLFFAQGECSQLSELELISHDDRGGRVTTPWQADDIRRAPDGGISRVHLWFPINIRAGEKRAFELVRHAKSGGDSPARAAMPIDSTGNAIRFTTDAGTVRFNHDGGLEAIGGAGPAWEFGAGGAFPRARLYVPGANGTPSADITLGNATASRSVEWSSGPLFAKLRVRLTEANDVRLEQCYRIPRNGSEIVITNVIFPGKGAGVTVKENQLLQGVISKSGGEIDTVSIPAGIRFALRGEHAYTVSALRRSTPGEALLAVPLVIGGGNGTFKLDGSGGFVLRGLNGLQRGGEGEKETLYAYWSEVRVVPADANTSVDLWRKYQAHVQPLVAVVEEPAATVERLHGALKEIAGEMKPIGWRQDAGRALMLGETERMKKILPRPPAPKEADVKNLVASAVNATAKLTNNGARKLREDEKGRAYGPLDPYHITYTQSAAAAIAVLAGAPPTVNAVNLAMATGVKEAGGRVDAAGFPYIECFNRTLNMQLGPVLFGLTTATSPEQRSLAQFYRDLANSPPVQGVFGRAQRPYTGAPATSADQTDYLYQSICDFWLRATELLANENLKLHPLLYGRYTDCIDVMADLYHGVGPRDKAGATGLARANFFRGQAHTHRWLGWSCAPYIRLLQDPAEHGQVGLTEAIHFTDAMKGRWKNWPDLTFYILADVLVRDGLDHTNTPTLPAAPSKLSVQRNGPGVQLSWNRVDGAAEYRVYRAEHEGGPYRWLNSPYAEGAAPPTRDPSYADPQASGESVYVVTAVDRNGRESAWPDSP